MPVERIPLSGGIGNQLFQVAASHHFAELQNYPITIIRSSGNESTNLSQRHGIESLNLPFLIKFSARRENIIYRLDGKLINVFELYRRFRRVQVQMDVGFDPEFKLLNNTKEIRGYFQSYKYVEKFKHIFQQATNQYLGSTNFCKLRSLSKEVKPVSLHVRRGDYESLKGSHGILSAEFYENALETLGNFHAIEDIWVFSDEPEKAKRVLKESSFFKKMDFEVGCNLNDIETLVVMTHCKGHIIANSTFSWWGAILSDTENAVIAPKEWFYQGNAPKDLLPLEWLKITSLWES